VLRHTYVTTMLDAGVNLRDVQIAACRADPRTTMRYDRGHKSLDRHPNYILAAYMASGTSPHSGMSVHFSWGRRRCAASAERSLGSDRFRLRSVLRSARRGGCGA
jgi:hypothetical protein